MTWGVWKTVRTWAEANGYEWSGPSDYADVPGGCATNHPVHSVSWYDVLKWCNAKSAMERLTPIYKVSGAIYRTGEVWINSIDPLANGYRLPLEAEWEFVARGGNHTNNYTYAGSNDLNAVGWYNENSGGAACNPSSGRGTWPVGQKAANELGLYDMSGNVNEWCWTLDAIPYGYGLNRGGSWVGGCGPDPYTQIQTGTPMPRRWLVGGEWIDDPTSPRLRRTSC